MKTFIFLSSEGSTYQPGSTSIDPDTENLQVIGFSEGNTARDALKYLVTQNDYLSETNFDEV